MMRKLLAVVIALLAGLMGGAALIGHARFVGSGPAAGEVTVVIPKGSGLEAVAHRLAESGVIADRWVLMVGARLHGLRPKAGEYLFPAHVSPRDALVQMAEGHTVVHRLTVAEGLTVRHVLSLVHDADFLAGDVTRQPEEGSLLPETWYLSRDDSRDELVARMARSMSQALDGAWAGRAAGLPLKDKRQALVLASIVERETALASERPHVAAVFENRLRKGMRLQSDPTVIYGLSRGWGVLDRPLVHEDLASQTLWNTYVIDGLPPTPIANPGRASIEAVLHPLASDDLYFVADGSGGHVFAQTLEAHNANVTRLRQWEREHGGR
jgi:UPF0755 protein